MKILKILIIEDDIHCARRLESFSIRLGHSITGIAGSVNDGIALYSNQKPDLIIMDIELSDNKEGGILLANVFNEISKVPIIFYTSNISNDELRQKASQAQSVAILSKTFDLFELEANVNKAIFELINESENPKISLEKRHNLILEKIDDIHVFLSKVIQFISIPNRLFIKNKDSFWLTPKMGFPRKILYKDICWIQTDGKDTVKIYTEKEQILYGITIGAFDKKVTHASLCRIHKSYIINMDKAISYTAKPKEIIIIKDNKKQTLSYSDHYFNKFKGNQNIIYTGK